MDFSGPEAGYFDKIFVFLGVRVLALRIRPGSVKKLKTRTPGGNLSMLTSKFISLFKLLLLN